MSDHTENSETKDLSDFKTFVTELPTLLLKHTPEEMAKFVLAVRLNTIPTIKTIQADEAKANLPFKNYLKRLLENSPEATIGDVRGDEKTRGETLDFLITKIGYDFSSRRALVGGLHRARDFDFGPLDYYYNLQIILNANNETFESIILPNNTLEKLPVFLKQPDPRILPFLQDPTLDPSLSLRARNAIFNGDFSTYAELLPQCAVDLLRVPNFGRKSINELNQAFEALILDRFGKKPPRALISETRLHEPLKAQNPWFMLQHIQSFVQELDKQPNYVPPIDDQIKSVSPVLSMNFNLASFQRKIANDSGRYVWYRLPFAEATLSIRIFVDIARDAGNAFNAEIDFKQHVAADSNGKLSGIFGRTTNGEIHLDIKRTGDNFTLVLTERAAEPDAKPA
jgi:hypothetical protein